MSTEKVAQLTFQTTEFNSACIVCLCGSERVCAWSERVCACVGVCLCACVYVSGEGPLLLCPAAFQWNSCVSLQPPPNKVQTAWQLSSHWPTFHLLRPIVQATVEEVQGGGEKHNREKERTERLVRKFAVKKHEKSWRDISSCFQQRVIRRRKQNDSYILIILRRQHFLKL